MTLKEMLVAERKEIDSDIVKTQQQINELFNDLQDHKEQVKLIKKTIKLTRKDYNKLLAKRNKLDNSINDLKL